MTNIIVILLCCFMSMVIAGFLDKEFFKFKETRVGAVKTFILFVLILFLIAPTLSYLDEYQNISNKRKGRTMEEDVQIEILPNVIRCRDDKRQLRFEAYDLARDYCEENKIVMSTGDNSDEEPFIGEIYYGTNFARCRFNESDDIKKHVLTISKMISEHIHNE